MAKVFIVYGPRGAGKTGTTVRIGEALERYGFGVGGFFQRATYDEMERRGYDLVSMRDRANVLVLARPGGVEKPGISAVCTYSFSQAALDGGRNWLERDAESDRVLVIDEVSKLEVRGEGHAMSLRWALGLGSGVLLLLSVRGDQLFYVVDKFGLEEHIVGYVELPVTDQELSDQIEQIADMLRRREDVDDSSACDRRVL